MTLLVLFFLIFLFFLSQGLPGNSGDSNHDEGCERSLEGRSTECVDVRGADWIYLDSLYQLNETMSSGLCKQDGPDHCCMCLVKNLPEEDPCTDTGCKCQLGGHGVCVNVFSRELPKLIDNFKYFGSTMAKFGFGYHIDWRDWESYSIASSDLRKNIVENSNNFLTGLKYYIEKNTLMSEDEPYHHRQLFHPPDNVNDLWVTEISLASDHAINWFDKINMALHGGYFTWYIHLFFQYSEYKDRLTPLIMISEVINYIDLRKDLSGYLTLLRDEGFQRCFTEYMDSNLTHDVDCLYSMLGEYNLTFYNTLIETIPKESLLAYFQEFVSKFFDVINSSEIESNYQTVREGLQTIIRNTDFDRVFSKMSLVFLRSRSLVLDVDIMELFRDLDSLHRVIGEESWSILHGRRPEMVQFTTTFMTKTINSEKFWQRLDELCQELVANLKTQYLERQQWLWMSIKTKIIPFFMRMLDLARTKDKSQLTSLLTRLQSVDIMSYIEEFLDNAVTVLSRHYLSCYTAFYGKPDFNQLVEMAANNPVVSFFKSVFIIDWPEEQKVPENWPGFVRKLQDSVLLILSGVLGSCSKPVLG